MVKSSSRSRKSSGRTSNNNQNDEAADADPHFAQLRAPGVAEAAAAAADEDSHLRRSPRRNSSSNNSGNNNEDGETAAAAISRKKRKRAATNAGASKRKSRSRKPPPEAAAAAGDNGNAPDALSALCRMLVEAAPKETLHGGVERSVPVDVEHAANILEATAGNVGLAVNLYWDNYFATKHHHDPAHQAGEAAAAPQAEERKPPARRKSRRKRGSDTGNDETATGQQQQEALDELLQDTDESSSEERKKDRKRPARGRGSRRSETGGRAKSLRRSLDPDFRDADRPLRHREDPDGDYDEGNYPEQHDPLEEERPSAGEESDGENAGNRALERRNHGGFHLIGERGAETSTSISDDDIPRRGSSGGVRKRKRSAMTRQHDAAMRRRIKEAADEISKKILKDIDAPVEEVKRRDIRKGKSYEQCSDDDGDPDEYIDDRDWLDPEGFDVVDSLWGTEGRDNSATEAATLRANANAENNDDAGGRNGDDNADAENNVIDVDDNENGENEFNGAEQRTYGPGIPYTWLNAGFHLSECGTGLIVRMPQVEDIEFLAWRQQQNASRRNEAPPPYHCRALTSVLSIVTALLYSGASLQSSEVTLDSGKTPWAELSLEAKKREFEGRLADALSTLIHIAASSSIERKRKALRKHRRQMKSSGDVSAQDKAKEKRMLARMHLVPTCVWEEELAAALVPRAPDGPAYRRVPVKTSWTNVQDVRLYVLSTMRSFTAKGGVALLLETLLRIHGSHYLLRQIKKSRNQQPPDLREEQKDQSEAAATRKASSSCLIQCTCEERQKTILGGKPLSAKIRNDPEQLIKLLTPPGNECISVELLSLILTGALASSWKDCNVNALGVGLLTANIGEVSRSLARPERPVWVLRGDTCYSVAFVKNGNGMDMKTVAKLDKPMASLQFCHWNGWYGETDKSEFRVITGFSPDASVLSRKEQKLVEVERTLKLECQAQDRIRLERKKRQLINSISSEQQEAVEKNGVEHTILPIELQRLRIHPEDQQLFPENYHMWRFDMGQHEGGTENQKRPVANWVPYHRLDERQQRIVEIRLGPKINQILWTRWPTATIDSFTNDPVV